MKKIAVFVINMLMVSGIQTVCGQLAIDWQGCVGSENAETVYSMAKGPDGFVVAGLTAQPGSTDVALFKSDSLGNQQWLRTYGGSGLEEAHSVISCSSGGYLIAGETTSDDGDITMFYGVQDAWVVRTDNNGNLLWQKTFGGTNSDMFNQVIETYDGNFLAVGNSNSNDGDLSGLNPGGGSKQWWVKFDSTGTILNQYLMGGSCEMVIETTDSTYVGVGASGLPGYGVPTNYGSSDVLITRFDSTLSPQWVRVYGGTNLDRSWSVMETSDHYFIVGGYTWSNDVYVSGSHGSSDNWALKLDSAGDLVWQACYGGTGWEEGIYSMQESSTGDYMLFSVTRSTNGQVSSLRGNANDVWVVVADTAGNLLYGQTFGGGNGEFRVYSVPLGDNAYVLASTTQSNDYDVGARKGGSSDGWIFRLQDRANEIRGNLFVDYNSNQVFDSLDVHMGMHQVSIVGAGTNTFTHPDGSYSLFVPYPGSYTVRGDSLNYYTPVPASRIVNFSGFYQVDSLNDFAYQATTTAVDLEITLSTLGVVRPGFDNVFHIDYQNVGGQVTNGEVYFIHSFLYQTYQSSSQIPLSIGNDTVKWQFINLLPFEQRSIDVTMKTSQTANLGGTLTNEALVLPIAGDPTPLNNQDTVVNTIVGSFDPNDILVDTETILLSQLPNPPYIEYKIRFQNTGTFPATFVRVANPVSPMLDMSTFDLIATSHTAQVSYLQHSRNLDFFFDNINLPDSNTNEPGSHGFIRYRIKPYSSLVNSDTIPNFANIYFDYNYPVITNVVTTVIINPVSVQEINDDLDLWILYPDPFSSDINVRFTDHDHSFDHLTVYNMLGEIVYQENIIPGGQSLTVDLSHLNTGMYIIKATGIGNTLIGQVVKVN